MAEPDHAFPPGPQAGMSDETAAGVADAKLATSKGA